MNRQSPPIRRIMDFACVARVSAIYALILFVCSVSPLHGQKRFEPHTISKSGSFTKWVEVADLDGDGDLDVLSASRDDNQIVWYEHTDGQGSFGPPRVITRQAIGAMCVVAADIDGDGDQDVISTSHKNHTVAWYSNLDGKGEFGAAQVITRQVSGVMEVHTADVDGDGDVDVLSSSFNDHKVAWYENTNGRGEFAEQKLVGRTSGAHAIFAVDLDGDNDLDVLSGGFGDNRVVWFENADGRGRFGRAQIIDTLKGGPLSVVGADLDGDGDTDVIAAHAEANRVSWWENKNGTGAFGKIRVITDNAALAQTVRTADLDGDGDVDIISASSEDDKVSWYENTDSKGTFGPQRIISQTADRAIGICAADIDKDGDIDVLSASANDNVVSWYENRLTIKSNSSSADCTK